MRTVIKAARVAASIGAIAIITAVYTTAVHVNPTTVALSYLVVILLVATWWGIVEATTASIVAMLCFNFFFLPPVGTLTIADPQNWVALVAFLVTAIVASQLSGRARKRKIEAVGRQRDLERLYALSRSLLLSEGGASMSGTIARHIAEAFELPGGRLYDHRADTVSWAGSTELPAIETTLRDVARRGDVAARPGGLVVIAIQLGGAPIGSLAIWQARTQRHRAAVDRQPGRHRAGAGARRRRPPRAPRRRARAANCARPCWTRWPTSSRRRSRR